MNDFDYEVYQRKRMASGARHRVCGSKSKKCSLPSDNLTKKQWKERCGEVMSYNLSKPMNWEEFGALPIHIQKEYLLNLISKYSTSARDLSMMFGISPSTFSKYCGKKEFDIDFVSKRVPASAKQAFHNFCNQSVEELASEPAPMVVEKSAVKHKRFGDNSV